MWGRNCHQQISTEEIEDVTSPRRFRHAQNALDAACGPYSTTILLTDLQFKEFRTAPPPGTANSTPKSFHRLAAIDATMRRRYPICLANSVGGGGDRDHFIQNHSSAVLATPLLRHLTNEQKFVQDALYAYAVTVKPFLKKLHFVQSGQTVDQLCQQYLNLVNVSAVNLRSMTDYFNGFQNCQDIVLLRNVVEMVAAHRTYTKLYCDAIASHAFHSNAAASAAINMNFLADKPTAKDVQKVFLMPFRRVWAYVEFIYDLLTIETTEVYRTYLGERRTAWEKFKIDKDLAIEQAELTDRFWELNGKMLVPKLQIAERRLVLDSKELPLKLLPSSRFSSHWMLLFNDVFCHHNNNTLQTYPLKTVWILSLVDAGDGGGSSAAGRRNAFKVITPEDSYVLVAKQHEDKVTWMNAFEHGIRQSLDRPGWTTTTTAAAASSPPTKVPQYRNASYTFSDKHGKYPGVKYFGRWYMGQMHGIGHLEFSDGKAFNGQMANGEIHGFGRMFTPNVGIYAGDFANGRYHGHGQLEMKSHGSYEGNFRDGLFHGHGTLKTDQYTYIGEFVNNQKCGYGVLDDSISGDKYMGIFVDNRKCGFGVSITMEGNYFEGIFANDVLAGEGVAVFEDGSYYDGEMQANGPNGKGTLFVPRKEIKSDVSCSSTI